MLTHHQILALVAPYTRQGLHVDLTGSDRLAGRLQFKPLDRAGELPCTEAMQLEQTGAERFRLTRTLTRALPQPSGLHARLVADGAQHGELLQRVQAVQPAQQLRSSPDYQIALQHRLAGSEGVPELILTQAVLDVPGLRLAVRVSGIAGYAAEVEIHAPQNDIKALPEDLLAVLGWSWGRLARTREGWQVIAAGNASFHGAVAHDMGTALADRIFHFNVQTTIDAFLAHATAQGFTPEVMAYLRVRPDKLDDTAAQLEADHLVGASPRGWEDISNVLKTPLTDSARRLFVQGRIGAANAAEFFGVLRELQAGADVLKLLAARRGEETAALLPRTLDGLYGMVYGLLAACTAATTLTRGLEILEQLPELRAPTALPLREAQTLAMELLLQKALENSMEATVLDSPAYQRYAAVRGG